MSPPPSSCITSETTTAPLHLPNSNPSSVCRGGGSTTPPPLTTEMILEGLFPFFCVYGSVSFTAKCIHHKLNLIPYTGPGFFVLLADMKSI
jgi:hypothetical protein